MDVLDRAGLNTVVSQTLEVFGRIDVLIYNAIYQGPGLMFLVEDIELGYTVTEATRAMFGDNTAIDERFKANTPEDTAEVVSWLASSDLECEYTAGTVYSATFFPDNGIEQPN